VKAPQIESKKKLSRCVTKVLIPPTITSGKNMPILPSKQVSQEALLAIMDGLSLNSPVPPTEYHTLHLTYPALHLLPEGSWLYLNPPTDCCYREAPRFGTYHLAPENLSFFQRFPINQMVRFLPSLDTASGLLAINTLAAAPGRSHLDCVSFVDASGVLQHIICLTVSWNHNHGTDGPTQYTYQLSDIELACTFGMNAAHNAHPWLDLLFNLVYRCSDRAYLHVQEQLRAHVPTTMVHQELLWTNIWDSQPNLPGHELLMTRLECQLEDGSRISLSSLDAKNLSAHAAQPLSIVLPCGHTQLYMYAMIRAMPDHKCLEASCRKCNQPVLGPADVIALSNRLNRVERYNFYWAELELAAFDAPVPVTGREIEASMEVVCSVLEDMLSGFEVPSSATPSALSLVNMPETQIVLRALQQELRNAGNVVQATPAKLLRGLESEAMSVLRRFVVDGEEELAACLAPGLLGFLAWWLKRAVNDLSGVYRGVTDNEVDDLSSRLGQARMLD
jgi:hypothetical protein